MGELDARQLGSRVRDARKRKGLTQDDLAHQVRLDRTIINKIEAGLRKVAALELSDIAQALGVGMSSFFEEPAPAIVSHRSSQGLDTAESQIDGLLADIASEVEFVQGLTSLTASRPPGEWKPPQSKDDAEVMAALVRDALEVEREEPLTTVSRLVAGFGLFVFARDLGADTADAGTVLLRDGGVSLVNSANKIGRRRLSVAHELAHFLIADEYTVDWRVADDHTQTESRFDYFARALLLPPQVVPSMWNELHARSGTRTAAVIVASRFQVDMATLARRLVDLHALTPAGADEIRAVRTTQADMIELDLYPSAEGELSGTEQPRAYQQAVLGLVRDERISRERALELLWDTLLEEDLPQPHMRDENEIWQYVS